MFSKGTTLSASLALAFSLTLNGLAFTAPITYDFTGSSLGLGTGNLGVSSTTVTSDGLDMEVSAVDESNAPGLIARNDETGLGVVGEPGTGLETNQVGEGESLVFDFSPSTVAIIDTVIFETGMQAGSLNVLANNIQLETISWTAATGGGNTGNSDIAFTFSSPLAARTAQSFTFVGVADSFRVKSLTVEIIPEPASILLCMVGLGAVALQRKRGEDS